MKSRIFVFSLLVLIVGVSVSYGDSVRFAVLGDTRGSGDNSVNETIFSKIVEQVSSFDPPVEFVIVVGDLVLGSDRAGPMDQQFARWKQIAKPWYDSDKMIGAKVYVVPGNHDQGILKQHYWQEAFDYLPDNGPEGEKFFTYSFEFGPVHFSVVNTSAPSLLGSHTVNLDWLKDDLANTDKPIKLVFGHEPAYPAGPHRGSSLDAIPPKRDKFWKLLVDNGVKAYFCGHEHIYDHWIKDGVHQIISGGAGAPGPLSFHYLIVDADDNDVTVSVYKVADGKLKESYKLSQTEGVPNEDRSDSGSTSWLFNNLPCLWMIVFPLALLYLGSSITDRKKDEFRNR